MRTQVYSLMLLVLAFSCQKKGSSGADPVQPQNNTPVNGAGGVSTPSSPVGSMEAYNAAKVLEGKISGKPWQFGTGFAHYAYDNDPARKGTLVIDLNGTAHPHSNSYGCNGSETMSPDDGNGGSYLGVSFYLPKDMNDVVVVPSTETKFPGVINAPDSLYFSLASYSVGATSGRIQIVQRTETKILGIIEGKRSDKTEYAVQGRFEATICP